MKKTIIFFLLIGLLLASCGEQPMSYSGKILQGEHSLRRMSEFTQTNSGFSGFFIICYGGVEGSTENIESVRFAWKMNDGNYAISTLPIEKIRLRIDNKIETPTIKFRWTRTNNLDPDLQAMIDLQVIYAVVTVKGSDWPIQVNLPLDGK